MARIFNIYFQHEGRAFSALVTVAGRQENNDVKVTTTANHIQVQLKNGRLVFPISEVLSRVLAARVRGRDEGTMHITETISLQLLNTSW